MRVIIFQKYLLIFAIMLIPVWFIYITFTEPVIGIDVEKDNGNNWRIKGFDSKNISETYDLRINDIVKKVNNEDANEFYSIKKWRSLDQAEILLLSRDDRNIEVNIKKESILSRDDLLSFLISFLSSLIAFLLYRTMLHSRSAKFLSLVLLNLSIIFLSLGPSVRGDVLGKICISILMMSVPVTFFHFFIVFLKEKGNIQRVYFKILKVLYIFIGFIFIISLSLFFQFEFNYNIYRFIRMTILLFFILGLAVNFILLISLYVKHKKEHTYVSTIIKSIWVSLFISFSPIICFSFIPMIIRGNAWIDPFVTGWFVLFLPLSFAYLIASKKLYDIDMIVRRILFTALISMIPSTIFIGIIRLLLPHDASAERLLVVFILFVIILTFALYSLEYFTTKLEPVMFPRKYYLQSALKNISRRLRNITSFRELNDIILVDIVSTLQVFGGSIVFKYDDKTEIISQGDIDSAKVKQIMDFGDFDHDEFTCFEINHQEEYTSYLIMTQKKTMTLLGSEERQWLNLIITYLAVSMENVHLIRKLTTRLQQLASHIPNEQVASDFIWFRKLMFELQEKERVRIATELHDTTMQDLFFLKERLASLLEKYMFSDTDRTQMINIVEYIDVINSNLRQSCFELHPYLLKEVGLVQTIERLVEFEMAVCSFELEFEALHPYNIELWDMDRKQHIFRMVQELINNAKKHSQASRVKIILNSIHNTIYLNYEDDGLGFDPNNMAAREIGSSGIGVEQMKSRILSLNGQFELTTSRGNGMKFSVIIPMKEGQIA